MRVTHMILLSALKLSCFTSAQMNCAHFKNCMRSYNNASHTYTLTYTHKSTHLYMYNSNITFSDCVMVVAFSQLVYNSSITSSIYVN